MVTSGRSRASRSSEEVGVGGATGRVTGGRSLREAGARPAAHVAFVPGLAAPGAHR